MEEEEEHGLEEQPENEVERKGKKVSRSSSFGGGRERSAGSVGVEMDVSCCYDYYKQTMSRSVRMHTGLYACAHLAHT